MDSSIILEQIDSLGKEIQGNSKLLWAIGSLLIADIILVGIRIIADFKLKNLDKSIASFNIKESKKILVYENLYKMMNDLTFVLQNESTLILDKISEIERFNNENYLYIKDDANTIINDFCNYFRRVLTDFRTKKLETELEFLSKFKECFNK